MGRGSSPSEDQRDPVTSPTTQTFETGPNVGNLANWSKQTTDARLYNHIVVTGEREGMVPVVAEATNTEPSSPTRIAAIGDRVYQYVSQFISTNTQAQNVANSFLKIHALEQFDLNFTSLVIPWLEVGDIVEFLDPNPMPGDPYRFLLSSVNIPLACLPCRLSVSVLRWSSNGVGRLLNGDQAAGSDPGHHDLHDQPGASDSSVRSGGHGQPYWKTADVTFSGESVSVPVSFAGVVPSVGAKVRVEGRSGARFIAAVYDIPWVTPTLTSPFTWQGAPFAVPGYRRDATGQVWLRGVLGTSGAVPSVPFTLPVGYRPGGQRLYVVNASGAFGRVDVFTTGAVTVQTAATSSYIGLDGISFLAEA